MEAILLFPKPSSHHIPAVLGTQTLTQPPQSGRHLLLLAVGLRVTLKGDWVAWDPRRRCWALTSLLGVNPLTCPSAAEPSMAMTFPAFRKAPSATWHLFPICKYPHFLAIHSKRDVIRAPQTTASLLLSHGMFSHARTFCSSVPTACTLCVLCLRRLHRHHQLRTQCHAYCRGANTQLLLCTQHLRRIISFMSYSKRHAIALLYTMKLRQAEEFAQGLHG